MKLKNVTKQDLNKITNMDELYNYVLGLNKSINQKLRRVRKNNDFNIKEYGEIYLDKLVETANAVKGKNGKVIDRNGAFIKRDDQGKISLKNNKKAFMELDVTNARRYVKALLDLNDRESLTVKGMRNAVSKARSKMERTIVERIEKAYSELEITQELIDNITDAIFREALNKKNYDSDQIINSEVEKYARENNLQELLDEKIDLYKKQDEILKREFAKQNQSRGNRAR